MRATGTYLLLFLMSLILAANIGCKKDRMLTTGGDLRFSTDTLTFDTVFTTQGSFTTSFKIFNAQNEKITISSVRLEGGAASYFKLNINGIAGPQLTNIEVAPNDSIYVFATVNIDPNNANTPFVVEDKVTATLNGKDFSVPLVAYGQNAYYIYGDTINTKTLFIDKPYVIVHSALVNPGQTLTIPAGARIYMHADSRLVVEGTLRVLGTKTDSVVFQGDRLDRNYFGYEGYPGEWGGIYFTSRSNNSYIRYAIIKNCGNSALGALPAAIQLTPDSIQNGQPQLWLDHTTIENSIGYGVISFFGTLRMDNCLVHTCGAQALALVQGGNYNINNCTFANYGTNKVSHIDQPTVAVLNYFDINEDEFISDNLNGAMRNCIIWGSLENELFCNAKGTKTYTFTLDHCLIRSVEPIPAIVTQVSNKLNDDPQFTDPAKFNYHLLSGSPARDGGTSIPAITDDLDGNLRSGAPDIGCYEFK